MNAAMPLKAQEIGWVEVGATADIPRRGARIVRTPDGDIAVFRTMEDKFFAVDNACPHRKGPLAQGIVMGDAVTCPLHNWVIDLATGEAQGADHGCVKTHALRVESGRIYLSFAAP